LHDSETIVWSIVNVQSESGLVAIELEGSVDIRHRDVDHFQ